LGFQQLLFPLANGKGTIFTFGEDLFVWIETIEDQSDNYPNRLLDKLQ